MNTPPQAASYDFVTTFRCRALAYLETVLVGMVYHPGHPASVESRTV